MLKPKLILFENFRRKIRFEETLREKFQSNTDKRRKVAKQLYNFHINAVLTILFWWFNQFIFTYEYTGRNSISLEEDQGSRPLGTLFLDAHLNSTQL